MTITKPAVNINGTSVESLLSQYLKAGRKIVEALGALDDTAPNARDYPQTYHLTAEASYSEACREHKARIAALADVRDQLMELISHLHEEIDVRAAREGGRS